MEEKGLANDGENGEVKAREEEVIKVDRTTSSILELLAIINRIRGAGG